MLVVSMWSGQCLCGLVGAIELWPVKWLGVKTKSFAGFFFIIRRAARHSCVFMYLCGRYVTCVLLLPLFICLCMLQVKLLGLKLLPILLSTSCCGGYVAYPHCCMLNAGCSDCYMLVVGIVSTHYYANTANCCVCDMLHRCFVLTVMIHCYASLPYSIVT